MKGETPVLFPGEGIRGSKRHGEIKVKFFGAFETVMKGRADASLGRCEERGMKVDGGTKQQRRHERQNGRRDEKGNKAIRGRCCPAGPCPPSVPTEMGELDLEDVPVPPVPAATPALSKDFAVPQRAGIKVLLSCRGASSS